jgi:maltose-binding protein MalE
MNRQMAVKQRANSRQMEFGIGMELYKGVLYSIPQMTEYLTLYI